MALSIGGRLGPYEVTAAIGAGGMGEVFRARDTKLNREVAIKVLPAEFAKDHERVARFKREAQILASLNHPNIAAVHGLEEEASTGTVALAMEYVEGEDLAQRLARGAIPIDDAIAIARQIAEGLEEAHEHGIIHRDLKPANVKVTSEGKVKILDFGLAKAMDPAGPRQARPPGVTDAELVEASPTLTHQGTQAGMIIGTAAYMSPEQAKGRAVDKRTDVWAFGVVLYEMLTGKRAFKGEDVSETLATVLMKEPDWTALPADIPPRLHELMRRCLVKNPRYRMRDMGDVRLVLDGAFDAPVSGHVPHGRASPNAATRPWMVALGLLAALAIALALRERWLKTPPAQLVRFSLETPAALAIRTTGQDGNIAVSPDGKLLAYITGHGNNDERGQLVIRAIDSLEAKPIQGVFGARVPFFSPDSKWVGFFQGTSELKKVPVDGGPAVTLCPTNGVPRGASWGDNHTIVFATFGSGLLSVSDRGGDVKTVSVPDARGEISQHQFPFVLPGSKAVLFTQLVAPVERSRVAVLDLATGGVKVLVEGASAAAYVDPGYIIYGSSGTLRAARFDPDRLVVLGYSIQVAEELSMAPSGAAAFAVSPTGVLAFLPGVLRRRAAERGLTWISRSGVAAPVQSLPPRGYAGVRLSPDGTLVALDIRDDLTGPDGRQVFVWNPARETLSPFTIDSGPNRSPVWTPDGLRIAFAGRQGGVSLNVFWQNTDGTGSPERLATADADQFPMSFTPDGASLLFLSGQASADSAPAVNVLDVNSRKVSPLLDNREKFDMGAELSPDGRFIAYELSRQGRPTEIFVQPFPNLSGGRWQVSQGGGRKPSWARSGRELFYLESGGLYAVPVQTGSTFVSGTPVLLFGGLGVNPYEFGRNYDATPDAQKFLVIRSVAPEDQSGPPRNLVVVTNWIEDLKSKLGGGR